MKIYYESSYYGGGSGKLLGDDELMHWKYIKREKKNGRWVYYYDESELQDAKKKMDAYESGYKTAMLRKAAADSNASIKTDYYLKNRQMVRYNVGLSDDERAANRVEDKYKAAMDEADSKAYVATKRYYLAGEKYAKAKKEYKTMKIKSLASRTIAKGAVKVANLLSKVFSKKKKK